jgi:hypothetical protein
LRKYLKRSFSPKKICTELSGVYNQWILVSSFFSFFFYYSYVCAYKAWFISPPCPHSLPYHPLHPLPLPPTPSIPSRNYFALISNFVVERV